MDFKLDSFVANRYAEMSKRRAQEKITDDGFRKGTLICAIHEELSSGCWMTRKSLASKLKVTEQQVKLAVNILLRRGYPIAKVDTNNYVEYRYVRR
ncbi:hypothetical protein VPHD164_0028 [Vibrio phage D164]